MISMSFPDCYIGFDGTDFKSDASFDWSISTHYSTEQQTTINTDDSFRPRYTKTNTCFLKNNPEKRSKSVYPSVIELHGNTISIPKYPVFTSLSSNEASFIRILAVSNNHTNKYPTGMKLISGKIEGKPFSFDVDRDYNKVCCYDIRFDNTGSVKFFINNSFVSEVNTGSYTYPLNDYTITDVLIGDDYNSDLTIFTIYSGIYSGGVVVDEDSLRSLYSSNSYYLSQHIQTIADLTTTPIQMLCGYSTYETNNNNVVMRWVDRLSRSGESTTLYDNVFQNSDEILHTTRMLHNGVPSMRFYKDYSRPIHIKGETHTFNNAKILFNFSTREDLNSTKPLLVISGDAGKLSFYADRYEYVNKTTNNTSTRNYTVDYIIREDRRCTFYLDVTTQGNDFYFGVSLYEADINGSYGYNNLISSSQTSQVDIYFNGESTTASHLLDLYYYFRITVPDEITTRSTIEKFIQYIDCYQWRESVVKSSVQTYLSCNFNEFDTLDPEIALLHSVAGIGDLRLGLPVESIKGYYLDYEFIPNKKYKARIQKVETRRLTMDEFLNGSYIFKSPQNRNTLNSGAYTYTSVGLENKNVQYEENVLTIRLKSNNKIAVSSGVNKSSGVDANQNNLLVNQSSGNFYHPRYPLTSAQIAFVGGFIGFYVPLNNDNYSFNNSASLLRDNFYITSGNYVSKLSELHPQVYITNTVLNGAGIEDRVRHNTFSMNYTMNTLHDNVMNTVNAGVYYREDILDDINPFIVNTKNSNKSNAYHFVMGGYDLTNDYFVDVVSNNTAINDKKYWSSDLFEMSTITSLLPDNIFHISYSPLSVHIQGQYVGDQSGKIYGKVVYDGELKPNMLVSLHKNKEYQEFLYATRTDEKGEYLFLLNNKDEMYSVMCIDETYKYNTQIKDYTLSEDTDGEFASYNPSTKTYTLKKIY